MQPPLGRLEKLLAADHTCHTVLTHPSPTRKRSREHRLGDHHGGAKSQRILLCVYNNRLGIFDREVHGHCDSQDPLHGQALFNSKAVDSQDLQVTGGVWSMHFERLAIYASPVQTIMHASWGEPRLASMVTRTWKLFSKDSQCCPHSSHNSMLTHVAPCSVSQVRAPLSMQSACN